MKKVLGATILTILLGGMISCTDVKDDGINTIIWEGSVVPEDSCYRNPVWEPDLSFPTVFEAAVGYYAMGADNEWSPGLFYTAPVLSSNNLMRWNLRGEAFSEKPDWAEGNIVNVSAGFAKTKGTYYLFYELANAGIGMAASKAPQGPYTDYGIIMDAESQGLTQISKPFFFSYGSSAFLFYNGGDGLYGQELTLSTNELAGLKNDKFKVGGNHLTSMSLTKIGDWYYLFGVTGSGDDSKIVLARGIDEAGPFLDQDGTNITNGGGTDLLAGSAENGFIEVNHVGGVIVDAKNEIWILYQATDVDMPTLSSGKDRHPLMLSRLEFDSKGWPTDLTVAVGGWNYPKFAK